MQMAKKNYFIRNARLHNGEYKNPLFLDQNVWSHTQLQTEYKNRTNTFWCNS